MKDSVINILVFLRLYRRKSVANLLSDFHLVVGKLEARADWARDQAEKSHDLAQKHLAAKVQHENELSDAREIASKIKALVTPTVKHEVD